MNMAIASSVRGQILHNEPMSKHCSWRAGGAAEIYFEPADKTDLSDFLAHTTDDVNIYWIGLGSNLLVRDGGIDGIVIGSLNRLNELKMLEDGRVYAECGVSCAKLARFCKQQGLQGADFLAGIPGTVGGALAMNAGAFGFETWQFVESVEMMNRRGELTQRYAAEFAIAYRTVSRNKDEWFSAGYFDFKLAEGQQPGNIKSLLGKRNASQPIGQPSCGSVFKNPDGDFAARLIEQCGLKGYSIGGACVSEKHANFIINANQASAEDIEKLIETIQAKVEQEFAIRLHTEVRIIGERL
jgi:UDP-N-acetylmuramate dehydrogenase